MSEHIPTDSRSIVRQQQQVAEAHRIARETELNDLNQVISTESGRRFVWRLLEMAAIYRNAFTGNSETYVNCGRQLIGQTLLKDMDNDQMFDKYILMQKEARARAKDKCVG
jgi:hypothetical protein